jgi:hypothetical protein
MPHESKGMSLLTSCIEWLQDWTEDLPPLVDEYDLSSWLEAEGCGSFEFFLKSAFRKSKTRQDAIEILRGLVWEWFLSQREKYLANIPSDAAAVPRLLALPQTAQKTPAWYAESRDLLTGHEFAAVVHGAEGGYNAAVAKKCAKEIIVSPDDPITESRTVFCSPLNPFQWGWRYEPIIRTLFETEVAQGRVDDTLGRIRHASLPRLAASPDGLIVDGPKAGRLVEIKAPSSRELNGRVPFEYYCQMQLQAEVADVGAVEYIEVRFESYSADKIMNTKEFLTPTASLVSPSKPERMGTVVVAAPSISSPAEEWQYYYSPVWNLDDEGLLNCRNWVPDGLVFGKNAVLLERSVWKIRDWWTCTVPRNRRWWSEVGQPAYEEFWDVVDEARLSGRYASRLLIVDSDSDCGDSGSAVEDLQHMEPMDFEEDTADAEEDQEEAEEDQEEAEEDQEEAEEDQEEAEDAE